MWDTLLIDKQIRELSNYTTPLPSGRIESALVGKRFDPYIRYILKEGLGQPAVRGPAESGWWKNESADCLPVMAAACRAKLACWMQRASWRSRTRWKIRQSRRHGFADLPV